MDKSTLKLSSRLAVTILCLLGLIELGLALWTVLDDRYKSLAYNLANVGYIDLWILRYLSLCLFASSIITLVMCLILIWGLCSTHAFLFIASTMIGIIAIGEMTIAILTFASKYETRITLIEQLPKLVITYRQGSDERARRALDVLQSTFRCCGADGRLSFQNNVPLSCNMFSVGCLTRTIYFLDSCMDALAYILLFFSLIKLFIVLFFYSFLCLYYRYRQARARNHPPYTNDSSGWRRSSSFNSSSPETSPKKLRMLPTMSDHDKEYIERRHDYKPSSTTKQIPNTSTEIVSSLLNNNEMTAYYDKQNLARKLSSISEKTEKTETDDSEPDLLRLKYYKPKRKANMTNPNQKHNPPVLPVIKARRKIVRDDDVDSGVERSSSEKSFEEQGSQRQFCDTTDLISKTKQTNNSSSSPLSFSNVFVTSTSQSQTIDDEVRQPLTTRSSPLFNHFLPNDHLTTPKPILKKAHQPLTSGRVPATYLNQKQFPSVHTKTSSLLENIPQPNPRSSLKQFKQAESLM